MTTQDDLTHHGHRRASTALALGVALLALAPVTGVLPPQRSSAVSAAPSHADVRAGAVMTAGCAGVDGPVPAQDTVAAAGMQVHRCLAPAVEAMVAAAAQDGVRLEGSGWRSGEDQRELRRRNCGTSTYAVEEMPMEECSPPTARPGESRHERGLALDLRGLGPGTDAATWMHAHAARYGLRNLPSEPWHWSVDGR